MAGFVPNAFRATLLEALVGRTALTTATMYLGLATAIPEDPLTATLTNITEVATAGYARASVGTFDPARTTEPVQIWNATDFAFPNLTADMTTPAPYAFLTTAASGTDAPIRYLFQLAEAIWANANDPLRVPADALIIE